MEERPVNTRSSIRPVYVEVDEEDNGIVRRKVKMSTFDYSKPVTPQSGVETKIGNLAYMVKNNLRIEHEPAYLSRCGSNPLEVSRFVDTASKNWDSYLTKLQSKQEEKED